MGEFYKMDFEAWDEGTDALTLEQEAAYLRLCHQLYRRKAAIPSAPATLSRIWRCHPNKARKLLSDLIVAGKVVEREGVLSNTRVTRELDDRETRRRQQADAGHTGGTRAQENRRKSLEINDQQQADARSTEQAKSSRERDRVREDTPKAPKGAEPEGFEEFRAAYPKRNVTFPTAPARKRWLEAIRKGAKPEDIIAGARAYCREQTRVGKVGTEFVKTADVWLNQQRWQDHASPEPAASQSQHAPMLPDECWRQHVRIWSQQGGRWMLGKATPPPDDPNTKVPPHILAEMNIHPAQSRAA